MSSSLKIQKPNESIESLKKIFENPATPQVKLSKKAQDVLWYLNVGKIRVWDEKEKKVNVWVKRAILEFFPATKPSSMNAGVFEYFDKLSIKKRNSLKGVRVVPGAIARYGSFVEKNCILMPSFINVGAYVGEGTMVDTWATVGSCAQIGKAVHLSGGVGVGGVLEPAQAKPVVIGDGAFLGSRAVVVEGVEVGSGAVLGAGLVLTASTKIFDLTQNGKLLESGFVPENAVVVSGSHPRSDLPQFGIPCALILGKRKPSTDLKTSLNQALREYGVSV